MIEYRARQSLNDDQLKPMWGKILTDAERSLTLTGPARILKPNGDLLAVYVPGAIAQATRDASFGTLHELRKMQTDNRGLASGMQRFQRSEADSRTRTVPIPSTIVGAFDPVGAHQYCRLTAFTGKETEKFSALFPLFGRIAEVFREHVTDRFLTQSARAAETEPEWVVPGTPFTTITVNNTYPTGVHVDKGDLNEGFSCLAVLRRGAYRGGVLTFPKFRVGVDMQDGDVILMDAHEAHGNTHLYCLACYDAGSAQTMRGMCEQHVTERISIVCYYRTKIQECGTLEEEGQKRAALAEGKLSDADEAVMLAQAAVSKGG